jgi:FKBP-type peptidyl-prolyl cis-trans isomerase
MKSMRYFGACAIMLTFGLLCAFAEDTAGAPAAPATPQDPSYAFGVAIGASLQQTSLTVDLDKMMLGLKDVLVTHNPTMTPDEAQNVIGAALQAVSERQAADNLAVGKKFLDENGKRSGVITTASGLQVETLKEGTGASPKETDMVKVDYVGTFLDGKTFDSSIARGEPAEFPLGNVIPGWTEGVMLMKVGGKARLYIPSTLAYGPEGAGGVIGPNQVLIFEIELLDAKAAE